MTQDRLVLARTLRAIQPYAAEVVLIGGWVHALYLAERQSRVQVVRTTDIDFSLPPVLEADERPPLLDLLVEAGYRVTEDDPASGLISLEYAAPGAEPVELDLLTEGSRPAEPVAIAGQEGLVVNGYPDQGLLLASSRWMEVGGEFHSSLVPPIEIRVPTLGAYVLVKALSSQRRPGLTRAAKDLVYIIQILRDEAMHEELVAEIRSLSKAYPSEYIRWRAALHEAIRNEFLLSAVADQLLASSSLVAGDATQAAGFVRRHFLRVLGETPAS